jgi:hypothetical protein
MAIANITGNILTDSGISTSSLLPLSGGTITGFLTSSKSITTGENGQISIIPSTNTSAAFLQVTNSDGTTYFGKNNNSGSYLGSSPNATLVYSTGSSPIMLYTNGNMIMTLTGGTPSVGGNVLINTTSDNGAKLQVSGTATFSSSVNTGGNIISTVSNTNTKLSLIRTGTIPNNFDFEVQDNQSRIRWYNSANDRDLFFDSDIAGTTRMIIKGSNGNVGIGTSSPTALLHLGVANAAVDGTKGVKITNPAGTTVMLECGVSSDSFVGTTSASDFSIRTSNSERMRITSAGIINTTSRLNVNGAGDNSLFSLINNGTTYTLGFSPNASASTSTTLTITTATTTWIYNGTGTASWTLPNPSGTNQMFWIKNAGTGVLTLNAFSGTNIINNSATAVSSITIAVGATALIQQDGNVRSYQLQ